MARITLDHLAHSYSADPHGPQDYALKEIDHVWEQGGAYALLGPSGCGKTTLLNIISGLRAVRRRGRILFDDRDVTDLADGGAQHRAGVPVPGRLRHDDGAREPRLPAEEPACAARTTSLPASRRSRGCSTSTRVLDRKARNLTADTKQKISLGRGLVRSDVAAILFDEPLTVIDPHLKWQLRSTLKELHRALDLTMIYVTHDQTEALTFADKVVVMHDGAVVQTGTPDELFERPAHTFVGHFIGSPGMNVLPCRVEGATAHVANEAIDLLAGLSGLAARPADRTRHPAGIRAACSRRASGVPVRCERIDDIGRVRIARVEIGGHALGGERAGRCVGRRRRGRARFRSAARPHLCRRPPRGRASR